MKLHRFVQIGDLHLGSHARNSDRRAALAFAIDDAIAGGSIAAWLFPGDANHGRMTIDDRNFLAGEFRRMAEVAPVVITPGNHDLFGDLDVFARLKAVRPIYVVTRPEVVYLRLFADGVDAVIFVLPYPQRAGLVAAGTPPGEVVNAAKLALQAIFYDAATRMAAGVAKGYVPLVIGHVNVAGSIMSAGQPNIGKEIEVDEALLQLFPHMFIGLNHIHKAQEISGAVYAGSICRLDWSEVDPKSYLEITYGPSNWGGYSGDGPWDGTPDYTFDWCRKPVPVPPMYLIEGELLQTGFRWRLDKCDCGEEWCGLVNRESLVSAVCELAEAHNFTGADIRARFTFAAVEKSLLNFELVKAPFVGARRLELDPVAIRDRATRAPEVMAATSLDDKAKAFVGATGQQWTDGLERKLAALQVADGAAFLTQVSGDKA